MAKNQTEDGATADAVGTAEPVSRREQAVARSLDSARTRAENRVQRFLDAALELIDDGDTKDFTVQEVVERSGQSLRSFYQYFGGKHELLLALFEESIRTTADVLRERVAGVDDAGERLHRLVTEYYQMCRPRSKGKAAKKVASPSPVLSDFAQQLLTAHPAEAARAFVPLVALFSEAIDEASTAGAVRPGLDHQRVAGIVLEATMFNPFSATIAGASLESESADPAEELWDLVFNGLASN